MRLATFVLLAFVLISCRQSAQNAKEAWFEDVAASAGIRFVQDPHASDQFYMPEIMGSGCALLDYDGDGDLDVLLLNAGPGSRLYRNELIPSGKLRFTDVTREAGFDYAGYGMGVADTA